MSAAAGGLYRTIVCDPPWPVKDSGPRTLAAGGRWDTTGAGTAGKRSIVPYARMSIDDIAALPVASLADPGGCHLYLWAVNAYLTEAYAVARAWGFKPSTLPTWCKPPMGLGLGGTYVNTTEFILFARRGCLPAQRRWDTTWFEWSRPYVGRGGPTHSAKPEAFTDLVEQVSPGPYLECFARRQRLNWSTWGNECFQHVSMEAQP